MGTLKQFKTITQAIDWSRLARPQADGYDSSVLAKLEHGWTKLTPTKTLTLCDGTVEIRAPRTGGDLMGATIPVTTDAQLASRLQRLDDCLTGWDEGRKMLKLYLDELWPFWSPDMNEQSFGCSSGHHSFSADIPVHAVYVTVNSAAGCAQGIYHEVAHLRLETMGIGIDKHDGRLLANHEDELFTSSVRHDKLRPMSAVLHGVYAWLMFTENDYQLHANSLYTNEEWQQASLHNLVKISRGIAEIKRGAIWTDEGADFAKGLYDWTDDLLDRTHALALAIVPLNEYKRLTAEYAR